MKSGARVLLILTGGLVWVLLWIVALQLYLTSSSSAQIKESTTTSTTMRPSSDTNPRVMTFYYNWYGNQDVDGKWFHWNQPVLHPNGSSGAVHNPPDSIGSSFWPLLGLYSSNDQAVVARQCDLMKGAGIDTLIVSWYPEGTADQGTEVFHSFQNRNIPLILDTAAAKGLTVAFHIEPYKGRTPRRVVSDMQYLGEKYGSHPATLWWSGNRGRRMLVFVYDSYLSPVGEWSQALPGPAYAIGLVVESGHPDDLKRGNFDGAYTYFASNGFVWGSSTSNWQQISSSFSNHIFIPCVGPGYNDERIRPWNKRNTKSRNGGKYYEQMWSSALELKKSPDAVGITSWNEYHEGTNVEPSIAKEGYLSDSLDVDFLALTLECVRKFKQSLAK
jgi:glycoprotein endo-alpha-1,2-mannosidase